MDSALGLEVIEWIPGLATTLSFHCHWNQIETCHGSSCERASGLVTLSL